MAKTNPIDSISINNVKYDFDPTELSSLTVTGNLTVNGVTATFNNITADTANLSVIKTDEWDNLSNPTRGYIETALIKGMASPSTMIISAANLTQSVLQEYYISCNLATISTNTISLYHKNGTDVNISGIASNLKIQSTLTSSGTIELIADNIKFRKFTGAPNYYLNFPVGKSGIIATVADIPTIGTVSYKAYYTDNVLSNSNLSIKQGIQYFDISSGDTSASARSLFNWLYDHERQWIIFSSSTFSGSSGSTMPVGFGVAFNYIENTTYRNAVRFFYYSGYNLTSRVYFKAFSPSVNLN